MESKIVIPNPLVKLRPLYWPRRKKQTPRTTEQPPFPNYMQTPRHVPLWTWHGVRVITVGIVFGVLLGLLLRPTATLTLFWQLVVPLLPLLFFAAPGFWRNACPLAALNQTPRLLGLTRNLNPPRWFKEYSFLIAMTLFLLIVPARKVLFNENGPALALLISLILGTAFTMGLLFKGKSGWCSSICPLLPVQRVYGQTPFVVSPNSHCQPCVGCTKNCYDFNPHTALLADFQAPNRYWGNYRKLFIGIFPGFTLAFYFLPNPPAIPISHLYGLMFAASMVSAGNFFLVDALLPVSTSKIATLYGAAALNLYYWFNAPLLAAWLPLPNPPIAWGLRLLVLSLSLLWIYRTYKKEARFIETIELKEKTSAPATATPQVKFQPDNREVSVKAGQTLLEAAEAHKLELEAGCRMGVCGADPVCVIKGQQNLSPMGADERKTVERLGLGENIRMACMAHVQGDVCVSLKPKSPPKFSSSIVQSFDYDTTAKRIVIIGNGIAGVTAADHVRRRHPKCHIDLIGREPHHLYNRMAITRLIYGRSAMQGLYLMPDKWYTDLQITTWLNTQVTGVTPHTQQVQLGTGETLSYDRLILTTGGESFLPPITGYGQPGTFVLRTAEDAMKIRAYVQEHNSEHAVIAGGGLLGLEAAYALHKLGLNVTVLERSPRLLKRQLDERGAAFLLARLRGMGLNILTEAEADAICGEARINSVRLKDGRQLTADLLLVCVGIRSETTLAHEIGLKVKRGVVVDAHMQTSDGKIYAAGDAAEFNGEVPGLWSVAVNQAEVAASNAVGGHDTYEPLPPVTMLKVAGIDLTTIGKVEGLAKDTEISMAEEATHCYRKVIINPMGQICGAILLGYPQEARLVAEAAKAKQDVRPHLAALRQGQWDALGAE